MTQSKHKLIKAVPTKRLSGQSMELAIPESATSRSALEEQRIVLSQLQGSNQALAVLNATHVQERAHLRLKTTERIWDLEAKLKAEVALVKKQGQSELLQLQARQADEVTEAEKIVLDLRSKYLLAQQRDAHQRRIDQLELKQEKAFHKEVKESRVENTAQWKLRIRNIKLELDKLAVLRADWAATLQAGTDSESRLSVFRSKQAALYETYGRADETPGEFTLRASKDLEAQLLTARDGLSKAQTSEMAKTKAAAMPPLYQDPDEASLHLAARSQRAMQEGMGAPVERDPIIDRDDRNFMPIDKNLLADRVEKEKKLLESKKPKVKKISLRLKQAREDQAKPLALADGQSSVLAGVAPLQLTENIEEAQ